MAYFRDFLEGNGIVCPEWALWRSCLAWSRAQGWGRQEVPVVGLCVPGRAGRSPVLGTHQLRPLQPLCSSLVENPVSQFSLPFSPLLMPVPTGAHSPPGPSPGRQGDALCKCCWCAVCALPAAPPAARCSALAPQGPGIPMASPRELSIPTEGLASSRDPHGGLASPWGPGIPTGSTRGAWHPHRGPASSRELGIPMGSSRELGIHTGAWHPLGLS